MFNLDMSRSNKDSNKAPRLAIRYKKKEKSKVFSNEIFLDVPPKIVEPLLLIPGSKATLCIRPIDKESKYDISLVKIFFFERNKKEKRFKKPVIINAIETKFKFIKYLSIKSLKNKPTITVGILAIISLRKNSLFRYLYSSGLFEITFLKRKNIFFLKNIIIARVDAKLIIISKFKSFVCKFR